ncbi:ribonuclease [Mesorhizobium sp. NBSH29]|uniref:ribonuclease T2 family protein n=1 Tax=Mesorhizobium sp. NBSH29 TaxID=2654249 RepID=UPI00189674F2|nr:ribonuclease T2 [Mesorhizobium sp. NBSH29]QPC87339.1 ribonuclease [Mesorhizobium sp. NBSH29]
MHLKFVIPLFFCALLSVIVGCEPENQAPTPIAGNASQAENQGSTELPRGTGFDFYVLSLSWSPSYCEAEGEDANRQQCSAGRPYAFVVHGLWPQYERGYPADCTTEEREVSSETLRTLYDIMPSGGLIRHQWRKHGTCTGLSQKSYFKVLRAARERISIPPEFVQLQTYQTIAPSVAEQAFLDSNPGLSKEGISVDCDRRFLRDVRICMTQDLQFRPCREVDRRSCRLPKVVMPPVRVGRSG